MSSLVPRIDVVDRRQHLQDPSHRDLVVEQLQGVLGAISPESPAADILTRLLNATKANYPEGSLDDADWALMEMFLNHDRGRGSIEVQFETDFRRRIVPEYGHQYHTQFLSVMVDRFVPPLVARDADHLHVLSVKELMEDYLQQFESDMSPWIVFVLTFLYGFAADDSWTLVKHQESGNSIVFGLQKDNAEVRIEIYLLPLTLDVCAYRYATQPVPPTV